MNLDVIVTVAFVALVLYAIAQFLIAARPFAKEVDPVEIRLRGLDFGVSALLASLIHPAFVWGRQHVNLRPDVFATLVIAVILASFVAWLYARSAIARRLRKV